MLNSFVHSYGNVAGWHITYIFSVLAKLCMCLGLIILFPLLGAAQLNVVSGAINIARLGA